MPDSLADNVRELLERGHGDARILKQILRACEHDELVSNYERNYVRKLAERHLYKKPEPKPVFSDAVVQGTVFPPTSAAPGPVAEPLTVQKRRAPGRKLLIIAGLVLVAVVISAVSMISMPGGPSDPDIANGNAPDITAPVHDLSLSVRTDLQSYSAGDLISVSGSSALESVNITITNPDGLPVWTDNVAAKTDGRFSTLAIAGGSGWEQSGTFTISAENSSESVLHTFSFAAS